VRRFVVCSRKPVAARPEDRVAADLAFAKPAAREPQGERSEGVARVHADTVPAGDAAPFRSRALAIDRVALDVACRQRSGAGPMTQRRPVGPGFYLGAAHRPPKAGFHAPRRGILAPVPGIGRCRPVLAGRTRRCR